MLLIRNQLEISKKEIIQELLDINKYITNDITIKLSELSKKKKKELTNFLLKITRFTQSYSIAKSFFLICFQELLMECNAVIDSQYSRGETIASNPVPAEIKDDVLEEYICKALLRTGKNVIPDDLQDCH